MFRVCLSILAVLFLLTSAPAQKADSAKDHFDKAFSYMAEEKYDKAMSELDQTIQMDGRFAEAYGLRGYVHFRKQEYDLALADFNKTIELAPNLSGIQDVYEQRSLVRMIKEDYAGALSDINKAIALAPGNFESYRTRALIKQQVGDLDGALADFARVIELDPDALAPYVDRATLYFRKGNLDAALADYTKALELVPSDKEAHLGRGIIYVLKGRVTEAVPELRSGVDVDPAAVAPARQPPGVSPASALDHFINQHPENPRGYEARAIIRLIQGQADEADRDFQKTVSLDPDLKGEIEMVRTKVPR